MSCFNHLKIAACLLLSLSANLAWANDCPTAQLKIITFTAGTYSNCNSVASIIQVNSGAQVSNSTFSGGTDIYINANAQVSSSTISGNTLSITGQISSSKISVATIYVNSGASIIDNSELTMINLFYIANNTRITNSKIDGVTRFNMTDMTGFASLANTTITGNSTNLSKQCFQSMGASSSAFTVYGVLCGNK